MRLRELYESISLFENYNGKVNKLKKEFPEGAAAIDQHVQWAVTHLKKNQAILWYLTIMEAGLYKNQEVLTSLLPPDYISENIFDSLNVIQSTLDHWVNSELANNRRITDVINSIRPGAALVDIYTQFTRAEAQINTDNEALRSSATPIEILQGDQPVLQVPGTGRTWWHLPYNSHEPESKMMGHCGACQFPQNNLLSLRDATPRPELTFEWSPTTRELYQTKGPKNSKPNSKYYSDIVALLLSDVVNGIAEESWFPGTDFSIFDLPENMLTQIIATKPKLIDDQIEKYPIDFLRAPKSVRGNQRFNSVAFDKQPGLSALINSNGDLDQSNDAWENAISQNQDIIVYAPDTIDNYKQRVGYRIGKNPSLLNYANAKVRNDFEILKYGIEYNHGHNKIFKYIPTHYKKYQELVYYAFDQREWDLFDFDKQFIDMKVCLLAIKNTSNTPSVFDDVRHGNFLNHTDWQKYINLALEVNPSIIRYLTNHELTPERLKIAAAIDGNSVDPSFMDVSLDDVLNQAEMYELAKVAVKTAPALISDFVNRYVFTNEEVFNICMSAVSSNTNTLLEIFDEEYVKGGNPTFKLAATAINNSKDGSIIYHITPADTDEIAGELPTGYVTREQYQKLAELAVKKDGWNLRNIHEDFRTYKISRQAVYDNRDAIDFINRDLLTTEELNELWNLAHPLED